MAKPVRMADIAEKLGISVVSVSKALSGKSGVSEEMRAKVVALAHEMGYEGVRTYSELPLGSNIGVLVADRFFSENAFYTSLYRSLVLACGERGLTCMVEIISQEAERARALPAVVSGRKAGGIIFMGNLERKYLQTVAAEGLPCLLLDFHVPSSSVDCVISDNIDGGCILTEHLLSQGVCEIGFVGSIRATASIMDRYLGYQRALRMAGLTPRDEWLLEDRDSDGMFIPLSLPDPLPQAFLCSCDEVGYQLVEALLRAGKRVPEDVAVCGYDDFRFATLCQPPLTSYHVDVDKMARIAVERLSQKIAQEHLELQTISIPGKIVIRGSSLVARENRV